MKPPAGRPRPGLLKPVWALLLLAGVLQPGTRLQASAGASTGAPALDTLHRDYRATDDAAWRAFNVGDAREIGATSAARRAAAGRLLAALKTWTAAPVPPGALQPAIEAALLARRMGEIGTARQAFLRLAEMVPPAHAEFGLVQFTAGAMAFDAGDLAGAAAAFERAGASQAFPARDYALFRLAELRAASGDSSAAIAALVALLAADPRSLQADRARIRLAEGEVLRGEYDSAAVLVDPPLGARARVTRGDEAARLQLLHARLERARGNDDAARQAYYRLARDFAGSPGVAAGWAEFLGWLGIRGNPLTPSEKVAGGQLLLRSGNEAAGLELLRAVAVDSAAPALRAEAAEKEALYFFGRRRYEPARQAYQVMARLAADLPARRAEARLGEARCCRNAGNVPAMERAYRALMADTAQHVIAATATWELAREYKCLGRFASCDSVLGLYIARFPFGEDIPRAILLRGLCRFILGRYDAALEDFGTLIRQADRRADRETGAYWRARARLKLGDRDGAVAALRASLMNAMPDGYGGFRVRALLEELSPIDTLTTWRPDPAWNPLEPDWLEETPLQARIHFRRGIDLARAGFAADAQAELTRAAELVPDNPVFHETNAGLAIRLGMYSYAMSAARRALSRTDSKRSEGRLWRYVYGLGHFDLIRPAAEAEGLDPMLVAGLVRQESLFDERALSRAGARGLMQLMLPTARQVARARGESAPDADDLYRPELSVAYGTHYLRAKIAEFDGRVEVALAAYNAGEAKAREWESLLPEYDPDLFMEMIDYTETKDYVRRVRYNQGTFHLFYDPRPGSR